MALDGKLLAEARADLEKIREENKAEEARRRDEVFGKLPELRQIDRRLRSMMGEVISATLGGDAARVSALERESLDLQARSAECLTEHGYPADYLEEIIRCRRCSDSGYADGSICSCLRRLYDSRAAKELSSLPGLGTASFEAFDLSFYDTVPDAASGISPRRRMERTLTLAKGYAAGFGSDSPNLLFQGGTGLGKTFLSSCIARVVAAQGYSVVYETAVAALEAFETRKFSRNPEDVEKAEEITRRYLHCDLMILDDLGTEMVTAFSISALYTLINTRLANHKKTIISTNLTMEELRRTYSAQIVSRLEGEYFSLPFAGRDIRMQKKERGIH